MTQHGMTKLPVTQKNRNLMIGQKEMHLCNKDYDITIVEQKMTKKKLIFKSIISKQK